MANCEGQCVGGVELRECGEAQLRFDHLRDLRFEFRSGKYAENDFEAMKVSLESEAALTLAEIDQVTESQVRRPRSVRPAAGTRGPQ